MRFHPTASIFAIELDQRPGRVSRLIISRVARSASQDWTRVDARDMNWPGCGAKSKRSMLERVNPKEAEWRRGSSL